VLPTVEPDVAVVLPIDPPAPPWLFDAELATAPDSEFDPDEILLSANTAVENSRKGIINNFFIIFLIFKAKK
jgi:hypothetical protein